MIFIQKQKCKNILASLLIASSLFFTGSLALPTKADAQSLGVPFGGRSQSAKYCSCSAGCWLIRVGFPRPGYFMWCPWTVTYMYYRIFPSAWQLGMGGSFTPCMQISYPYCRYDGGGLLMNIDGTSLY
jgi:hypothetical protein